MRRRHSLKLSNNLEKHKKRFNKSSLTYSFLQKCLPVTGVDDMYALFEVHGKEEKLNRVPINLSVVLDLSRSFNQKALQYSKAAIKLILNQLQKKDLINVVAFDGTVKTILPPQKVIHKDILKMKIDQIEIEGMADFAEGLIVGCENLVNQDTHLFINHLILVSDGNTNKNINEFQMLMKEVEDYHNLGLIISTIGVGNNFNEDLLESIAENGRGSYYFVNNEEHIHRIFLQEIKKIFTVITHQTSIDIRPKNGVQIKEVYGHKLQIFEEGKLGDINLSYWVSLGDLYNHQTKLILVKFSIPSMSEGIHNLFEICKHFTDVGYNIESKTKNSSFLSRLNISAEFKIDSAKCTNNINVDVEEKVEIIRTAQKIEETICFFDKGDFDNGKRILYKHIEQTKEKTATFNDSGLMEDLMSLSKQLEQSIYSKQKRKELHQQKYCLFKMIR
jgi:Ca-activated chloride channel homolog